MHSISLRVIALTAIIFSVAFFLPSQMLFGQSQITTGVITGTVVEQTGAVVAGVTVTATNAETNSGRTAKTNSEGRFTLLAL
ncbi:MAG TPA: carboxypeptidase-like regulatory domain-containing protein, partial [Candidatus Saccharimonadales bacterium]|nr:carboxypeptidase-like regulatory domain-containing protein [Candidatus Saccharimonadales bacterium]